jgi:hypothetical protein
MPWLSVCFGRRQKTSKRPSISPPLHLLLKVSEKNIRKKIINNNIVAI